jgi:hypothetical protein
MSDELRRCVMRCVMLALKSWSTGNINRASADKIELQ